MNVKIAHLKYIHINAIYSVLQYYSTNDDFTKIYIDKNNFHTKLLHYKHVDYNKRHTLAFTCTLLI